MQCAAHVRIERAQLRIGRHARVPQLHPQLHRSRQPGAWLGVSCVGLQASNAQRLFQTTTICQEDRRHRARLRRVAQRRTRTVRFDEANVVGL